VLDSEEFKHDASWLRDGIQVFEVDRIEHHMSLDTKEKKTFVSASFTGDGKIYISREEELDWVEVASCVGGIILSKSCIKDFWVISTVLWLDLQTLRRRGFPVDRILQSQNAFSDRNASQDTDTESYCEKLIGRSCKINRSSFKY
jgi:hypothetical protein